MLSMLETLAQSELVDLSQPMKQGMPLFPEHMPFSFSLNIRHTDKSFPGGLSMANDVMMGCTHSGTHIDAIGHFARNGCLHGGVDLHEAVTGNGGLAQCGIEQTPPIMRRSVLFDVAAFKDKDALEPAYAITAEDLKKTARAQGVTLRRNDVALIRTGWGKLWNDAPRYVGPAGVPGPDLGAAQWLIEAGVSLTGSDTIAFEVGGEGHSPAVHGFLLADQGVQIIENLNLEALASRGMHSFVFVAAPLRILGATASPIRPFAVGM